MTTSKRHEEGLATRRTVLGEAHVARAQAQTSAFDAPFQELITEAAWGHVWSRPTWELLGLENMKAVIATKKRYNAW